MRQTSVLGCVPLCGPLSAVVTAHCVVFCKMLLRQEAAARSVVLVRGHTLASSPSPWVQWVSLASDCVFQTGRTMATARSFARLRAGPRVMHRRSPSEHSHDAIGRRDGSRHDRRHNLLQLPAVATSVTLGSPPHLAGRRQGG